MRKFYIFCIIVLVFVSFGCEKQENLVSSTGKYTPKNYYELKLIVNDVKIPLSKIDTSKITDMSHLFQRSSRVNFEGISSWDVSNVKDMSYMFSGAVNFNEDISSWDTSNVERMNSMFKRAESFNQDISSWKTFYVEDMYQMFAGAVSFNQDLSNWDISNVEDMRDMFQGSPMENNPPAWYKK